MADALKELQGAARSTRGGGGGATASQTPMGAALAGMPSPAQAGQIRTTFNSIRETLRFATDAMRKFVAEMRNLTPEERAIFREMQAITRAQLSAQKAEARERMLITKATLAAEKTRAIERQAITKAVLLQEARNARERMLITKVWLAANAKAIQEQHRNNRIEERINTAHVRALKAQYAEEQKLIEQRVRNWETGLNRVATAIRQVGADFSRFGLSMAFVAGGGSRFLRPLFVGFANFMRLAQGFVGSFGSILTRGLGSAIGKIFGARGGIIGGAIGGIVGQLAGAFIGVLGTVTVLWGGAVRLWIGIVSTAVRAIGNVLKTIVSVAWSVVRGIGSAFASVASFISSSFGKAFDIVSRWLRRIMLTVTGLVAFSIREFAKLDQAIGKSASQTAGVRGATRGQLTGQALGLARQFRQDPTKVAETMFEPVSAGMTDLRSIAAVTGEALRLTIAGGMEDSTIAAKALVATMRALGTETDDVRRIAGILFAAQAVGIGNIEDFAKQFRRLVPAARSAHISLEQVATATALVSQMTGGVEVGFRGLEFLMRDITNVVRKAKQELSGFTGGLRLTKEGGVDLFGTMLAIRQEMDKLPVAQQVAVRRAIFQQQRMAAAAAAFMQMPMGQLGAIAGRVAGAKGGYEAAFQEQERAFYRTFQGLTSSFKVLLNTVGSSVSGAAGRGFKVLSDLLLRISDAIAVLRDQGYFDRLADSILNLVTAIGQLIVGDINFKKWSDALFSFIENIPAKLDAITDKVREWASKGGIVEAFKEIAQRALGAVSSTALGTIGAAAGRVGARLAGAGGEGYRAAMDYDPNRSVMSGVYGLLEGLVDAIDRISRWDFMGGIVGIIESIQKGWITYFPMFQTFAKSLVSAFQWFTDKILWLGGQLAYWISGTFNAISSLIPGGPTTVKSFSELAARKQAQEIPGRGAPWGRLRQAGGRLQTAKDAFSLLGGAIGKGSDLAEESRKYLGEPGGKGGLFGTINDSLDTAFQAVDKSVQGWLPQIVETANQMAGSGDMAVTKYNLWLRFQQRLIDEADVHAKQVAKLAEQKRREREATDFETRVLERAAAMTKNLPPGGEYDPANLRSERARRIRNLGVDVRTGRMSADAYRVNRLGVDKEFTIIRGEQEARRGVIDELKRERRERRMTTAEFDRQMRGRLANLAGTKTERGFDQAVRAMIGFSQADLRAQRLAGLLTGKQYRTGLRGARQQILMQEGQTAIQQAGANLGQYDLSAIEATQGGEGVLRQITRYRQVLEQAKKAPPGSLEWSRAQAELRSRNARFEGLRGLGVEAGLLKKQEDLQTREEKILARKEEINKAEATNIVSWGGVGKELAKKLGVGFDLPRLQHGGLVGGPPGKDVIPAYLTADEFVVNKDATRRNLPLLNWLNYAKGGLVEKTYELLYPEALPPGVVKFSDIDRIQRIEFEKNKVTKEKEFELFAGPGIDNARARQAVAAINENAYAAHKAYELAAEKARELRERKPIPSQLDALRLRQQQEIKAEQEKYKQWRSGAGGGKALAEFMGWPEDRPGRPPVGSDYRWGGAGRVAAFGVPDPHRQIPDTWKPAVWPRGGKFANIDRMQEVEFQESKASREKEDGKKIDLMTKEDKVLDHWEKVAGMFEKSLRSRTSDPLISGLNGVLGQ